MSSEANKPRVGVSSCLIGELVRYDGRQKRDSWISEELGEHVEIVSICPEVEAGMSVPRPPIRCAYDAEGKLSVHVIEDGRDVTPALNCFAEARLAQLLEQPIDGYILKARSPSCGLTDTPHFAGRAADAPQVGLGSGLWAQRLRAQQPSLLILDEQSVADAVSRAAFIASVFRHFRRRSH